MQAMRDEVGGGDLRLTVNGIPVALSVPRATPLLYVLRNNLRLNGPKFGCGLGECGACAVLGRRLGLNAGF